MGAAVLSRVDRLPSEMKKSLEFTKHEVAEALTYEAFNAAVEHMALSEFAILLASHEGREALGQTLKSADTIKVGTERTKVQEEIGREVVPEDLGFKPVLNGGVVGATETKKVADATRAEEEERAAALAEFHKAVQEDDHATVKRIGLAYGWVDVVEEGSTNV